MLDKIKCLMDWLCPEEREKVLHWWPCEWRAGKVVLIINQLPEEDRHMLFEQYKECWEVSPRVMKIFWVIQELDPEEREQLLKLVYNDTVQFN